MSAILEARPYVWPWHGRIRPKQTALLVFTGDSALTPPAGAVERLVELAATLRSEGVRIVLLPREAVEAEPPVAPDLTVVRPELGAFAGSDIDLVLRTAGLTDLLIAGFPFELGADCTMREANDLGYECLLVEDCCSALSPDTFAGAVSSVQMSGGIFGAVARSDEIIVAFSAAQNDHGAERAGSNAGDSTNSSRLESKSVRPGPHKGQFPDSFTL